MFFEIAWCFTNARYELRASGLLSELDFTDLEGKLANFWGLLTPTRLNTILKS